MLKLYTPPNPPRCLGEFDGYTGSCNARKKEKMKGLLCVVDDFFSSCVVVLWVLRFVLLCGCVVGAQFIPCDCVEDARMLDTPIFCVFLPTNMFTCMYMCVYIRICVTENPQHKHTTNKFEHPQHDHTTNKLHSNTTTLPNTLDHHSTNKIANNWIPVCPAKSTKISI